MKKILYMAIISTSILFAFDLPDIENISSDKTDKKSFERIKKEMLSEKPINLRDILKDDFFLVKEGVMISKNESKKSSKISFKLEKSKLNRSKNENVEYENYYKKEIIIAGSTSLINAKYNNIDKDLNIIDSRHLTILNGEVLEDFHCKTTSILRKPPKKALVGYTSPTTILTCDNGVKYISSYEIKKGKKSELRILSIIERELSEGANEIVTKTNFTILNNEIIGVNIKVDSDNSIIKTLSKNEKDNFTTIL